MVIMRTAPDAARAEHQHAEHAHQSFRKPGVGQDRVVLLVVIDHEKAQHHQPAQDAANQFGDHLFFVGWDDPGAGIGYAGNFR